MKKRTLLFIILFPLYVMSQRQGQLLIDSLQKSLPQLRDDKSKVNVLTNISTTYARIDCAKGIAIGQQSLALARQLNWPPGMGNALLALGSNYTTSAEYAKALACLDTAYSLGKNNNLKSVMLLALVDEAVVKNQQGHYAVAIDLCLQSLKIAEEVHDSTNIALNLNNIGTINAKIGRYEKALDYELQAYPIYERLHNRLMQAMVLSSLGDAYDGVGQRPKSLEYYTRAIEQLRAIGDRAGTLIGLANRAWTYAEDKEYTKAFADYAGAIGISDTLGDSYRQASLYDNVAGTYIDAAENASAEHPDIKATYIAEARKYLAKGMAINQKNKNIDALALNYEYTAQLDSVSGDYKGALAAYKQYKEFNDSIFNVNSQKSIQKVEDQRKIDLQEKQIQINNLDLHNQRNQRWLFIGGLAVLFLIGGLLFLQSRQRKKANVLLQSLNGQLDEANTAKTKLFGIISHDLRSPVANLINFLHLRKEAADLGAANMAQHEQKVASGAENLLYTMEDLLLWSKGQMKNFSPRKKPLAISDLFAQIRGLYPGGDHLRLDFLDPEGLELYTDGDYLKTILRNLTTNAIKAVQYQSDGRITWRAWTEGGRQHFSITDNGPGISGETLQTLFDDHAALGGKNGFGLHLVRDFAAAIDMSIDVQSKPGAGTTFVITA